MLTRRLISFMQRRRPNLTAPALLVIALAALVVSSWPGAAADQSLDTSPSRLDYADELLIQLAVSDLERAITFYRDVLELKLVSHDAALEWAKFDTNVPGVQIGIGRQDSVGGSGTTSINIGVRDVDAARRLLESRGVTFTGPSVNIPDVVKLASFHDPDGNRLRLAGPPDAADDRR